MDRREFIKIAGGITTFALLGKKANAADHSQDSDPYSILVDTTLCEGCRMCEWACAEAHGLPDPPEPDDEEEFFKTERQTSDTQWTVVNRYETDAGEVFVKKQCMHCLQPACTSACLTKAMHKTENGPVVWDGDKCMGCRYCMISCPFDMPKFEYHSANPRIQKCIMCWDRLQEGELPACVEACPSEALIFGKRSELLDIARERIYQNPDQYVHHIYGEHEAGGTGWLYLSAVPFEQLGFRTDVGTRPYPEYTKEFLYGVPVVLTLWPAFLLALNRATRKEEETKIEEEPWSQE